MDPDQIVNYRQTLVTLRKELEQLSDSSSEAAETVTLDQSKVGRLSRMDALQAQQMAQETARRRKLQLQKIEGALRRMETDDYGYCFKCGDEISEVRLNIDPTSTRCKGCMEKYALSHRTPPLPVEPVEPDDLTISGKGSEPVRSWGTRDIPAAIFTPA